MLFRSALLNTHLTDLKEITHDFLYENYRTEKLSRSVNSHDGYGQQDTSINAEDLANQSVRLKEEQLRREGAWSLVDWLPRAVLIVVLIL